MSEVIAGLELALSRVRAARIWLEATYFGFFAGWFVIWIWTIVVDVLWGSLAILWGILGWIVVGIVNIYAKPSSIPANVAVYAVFAIGNFVNWLVGLVQFTLVIGGHTGWNMTGYNVLLQLGTIVGITFGVIGIYAWIRTDYETAMTAIAQAGGIFGSLLLPWMIAFAAIILLGAGFVAIAWWGWIILIVGIAGIIALIIYTFATRGKAKLQSKQIQGQRIQYRRQPRKDL